MWSTCIKTLLARESHSWPGLVLQAGRVDWLGVVTVTAVVAVGSVVCSVVGGNVVDGKVVGGKVVGFSSQFSSQFWRHFPVAGQN